MIEETIMKLANKGILGLWTGFNIFLIFYFVKKNEKREEELKEVIKHNTHILAKQNEKLKNLDNKL